MGVNAYTMGGNRGRNTTIFGVDADIFRPERWLQDKKTGESENNFVQRLQAMNDVDLVFSGGSRTCIGKHLVLVVIYKIITTMVPRFDLEVVNPEKYGGGQ